jgi:hypothetical protein
LTYGFADSSGNAVSSEDPATTTAVVAAINEWNAFSSTTKVTFDFAPAGTSPDIQVKPSSDTADTGGCAAFKPSLGRLYYSPTFVTAAAKPNIGQLIVAHELGHALGLADAGVAPSPPSIMNNPVSAPDACVNPIVSTTQVQQTDASATVGCRQQGKNEYYKIKQMEHETMSVSPLGPSFEGKLTPQAVIWCTYEYGTINFYVDGVYDSSEMYLVSVSCS